jgi:hypothetical protein
MQPLKQYLQESGLVIAVIVGIALGCGGSSCATHAPPNLSPEARAAWYGTRVIKALDVLRDTAIAAQAQTPPLLSDAATRVIVETHRSLLETIHALPRGWPATVGTALTDVEGQLAPDDRAIVQPYVDLTRTLLKAVPHE